MELHLLDNIMRRIEVVDRFESLIWTERFTAFGDFELVLQATQANRALFPIGTRMVHNESDRIMTVETIENKTDSEGRSILTVSGRSLEQILEDRVATDSMANLTTNPNWVLTGTPGVIARKIFTDICKLGILSSSDIIPFQESVFYTQQYTAPEPSTQITLTIELMTVYDAIKDICEAYGLGFSLARVADKPEIRFQVFPGNDRTLAQDVFPPVVFSHDLENLDNTTALKTVEGYKNVAYVFAKNGSVVVYAPGTDATMTGFERRVMYIKHDGDEPAGAALTALLTQKGYDALALSRGLSAFDGEIPQRGSYKYGQDYYLGDIVEMRNADGVSSRMRVTEQIFVSDAEGDRSYPTLSVELTATPGSWFAADTSQTWATAGDETWATA